jgi:RNA polymerase sigma factor (sigma-70 family)
MCMSAPRSRLRAMPNSQPSALGRHVHGSTILVPAERVGRRDPGWPSTIHRHVLCVLTGITSQAHGRAAIRAGAGAGQSCGDLRQLTTTGIRAITRSPDALIVEALVPGGVVGVVIRLRHHRYQRDAAVPWARSRRCLLRRLRRVRGTSATDAELLADTLDPATSFALFYRRHATAVLRFVASRGVDAETAADVVSEAFFVALSQRGRYRAEHDTARLWLIGIAVRRLAEVRRREQRESKRADRARAQVLTEADRDSYAHLLQSGDALDALADLPESERDAVLARVVNDRSYAEIASALGLSQATARKRVSRGLARLRTRLERTA